MAAVALFLAGFLPAYLRAARAGEDRERAQQRVTELSAELDRARYDLQVARLRGQLGDLLQEANRNNFGNAASMATAFFDGIEKALAHPQLPTPSTRRQILEGARARRDEISADLARADPSVKQKLAQMYAEFAEAAK